MLKRIALCLLLLVAAPARADVISFGSPRSALSVVPPAKVVATGNITLSGTQTIDGVAVVIGDRVLAAAQTSAPTSGLYVVAAGAWVRTSDYNSTSSVTTGSIISIWAGSTKANTLWQMSAAGPITVGTTSLAFTQVSGGGGGGGITQLTGPVTAGPGSGSQATTIGTNAITLGNLQQFSAGTIACNPTGGTANVTQCTLGTNLSFASNVINAAGGGGGSTPSGTGVVHVTSSVQDGTALAIYIPKAGTALTDASATIQPATDQASQYLAGVTETASRSTTLGVTSAFVGQMVCIVRTSAAAFTHPILNGGTNGGTLDTFPASQTASQRSCDIYNGVDWVFQGRSFVTQ